MIAKAALGAVVWYYCVVPGMGVWACGCVLCGGMSDAMGSKIRGKTFSTGSGSRTSQSKKIESKKPLFDSVRKPDLGFSRERPFSTDKSDCIRNGLISVEYNIYIYILFFCPLYVY